MRVLNSGPHAPDASGVQTHDCASAHSSVRCTIHAAGISLSADVTGESAGRWPAPAFALFRLVAPPTARGCRRGASATRRAPTVRFSPVAVNRTIVLWRTIVRAGAMFANPTSIFAEGTCTGGLWPPRYRVLHVSYSRDPSKTMLLQHAARAPWGCLRLLWLTDVKC